MSLCILYNKLYIAGGRGGGDWQSRGTSYPRQSIRVCAHQRPARETHGPHGLWTKKKNNNN